MSETPELKYQPQQTIANKTIHMSVIVITMLAY